jgi:hypothetical protein
VRLRGVSEALALPDDPTAWLVLRDQRTGLEYLRSCRDVAAHGLELDLRAYQCHVFLEPSLVHDDAAGDWARLAWRLGLAGVPDVHAALRDQLLEPARLAVAGLFEAQTVRDIAGAGLAPGERAATALVDHALETLRDPLAAVAKAIGATSGRGASVSAVRDRAATRIRALVTTVREGRAGGAEGDGAAAVAAWLGSDRARWATLTSWAVGACLGDLVRASTPEASVGVSDAWAAPVAIARVATELELDENVAERVARTARALLAVPVGGSARLAEDAAALPEWLAIPAVASATGWNEWQGRAFVAQEPFTEWIEALGVRDAVLGTPDGLATATAAAERVRAAGFEIPSSAGSGPAPEVTAELPSEA